MKVRFYGVRGSCPWSSPGNTRYGANTATVMVEADPDRPILFDLGTGLNPLGHETGGERPLRAAALVTHLHFDHVQGLPFFSPAHTAGNQLDVYGPAQESGSLHEAMSRLIRPPYFPVPLDQFAADVRFHDVTRDDFRVGGATVKARPVPHVGPTVGYRVECEGRSVTYISDHQAPPGLSSVDDCVLELCDGVDLLIHDAQYTDAEFSLKPDWGHCTVGYAVLVATMAKARRLCLFHHDPAHDDRQLDALLEHARELAGDRLDDVISAREGLTLTV